MHCVTLWPHCLGLNVCCGDLVGVFFFIFVLTFTFIRGHSCGRKQKIMCSFSIKFHNQFGRHFACAATCWFVKPVQNWFCTINSQGREPHLFNFYKISFNIDLCFDASMPVLFKLGMTKLTNLISVCMTLTCTQGNMGARKLELLQSFCCKVAKNSPS